VATLACGVGNVAFQEGRKAELRKDWDSALVNYEKAVQSDPANALYLLHEKQARTQASLLHLKNGRRLVKEGRPEEAAAEFQKAASIDPSNEAAANELSQLLTKQAEAKKARQAAIQQALKPREESSAVATVQLEPLPQEPIVHLRIPSADSKKVFETLAKLAGLNIAFTSDFRPVPLSEDLVNIKQEDALNLVALQSKSFWKAVTPNTILIIPDTAPNRLAYDTQVVKTIYLSNPLAAADRTAITTALKQVLGLRYIQDNPDSNAIIIRDTPTKVAEAEQLVRHLDRAKAEILIEIEIVEADRDRIRDLGLTPATISSSGTITPGLEGALAFSPSTASSSSSSTATSVQLGTLSYRDYAAVLPSVYATALLNDSKTHILQSPQVRATDGQTAKLKIGSRVPYATGSFLPSLTSTSSTSSTSLLASTQFQYQDVGVNLELTPHLLASGEVAIHAKIEISSLGADVTVGGVSEPTFGQRVIEHDIRLREGEVNLLGGLLQSTQTSQVQGIPGLGSLPVLHYFFSQDYKEVNDVEVLVMLTPRVIRLPDSSPDNIAKPFIAHDDSGSTTPELRSIPQGVPGQSPQPNAPELRSIPQGVPGQGPQPNQ
jgi:general secretion pathway protein D